MLIGLRYTVTRAYGYTPYKVLFGVDPQLPSSLKARGYNVQAATKVKNEECVIEYADELAVGMHKLRSTSSCSRSKKYYGRQRVE